MDIRNAIVTGVCGMDGSYMVDYLLANTNLTVYALIRRSTKPPEENINHLRGNPRVIFREWDILDPLTVEGIIKEADPIYFFNFAAQSHVHLSWQQPYYTWQVNTTGVLTVLEALRKIAPKCRFYQASSSEMFGDVLYSPQDEKHPYRPRSPYGASKVAAHLLTKVYRESYGLYALGCIGFNHEGQRRHSSFVTRKITQGVARIYHNRNGDFEPIVLGNLNAKRDWSHASDFMDAIWRTMNQEYLRDGLMIQLDTQQIQKGWLNEYVLSSDGTHSVREFVELAFQAAGIPIVNTNPDNVEPATDNNGLQINYTYNDKPVVCVSKEFYRPAEVETLWGDSTKIRAELGWEPKISFPELVKLMVANDLK
jgi:GDPmannose 4,6-dehydratase